MLIGGDWAGSDYLAVAFTACPALLGELPVQGCTERLSSLHLAKAQGLVRHVHYPGVGVCGESGPDQYEGTRTQRNPNLCHDGS